MCLERCNFTQANIEQELREIKGHLDTITGVSFELYNLGPNSQLITNNLTKVGPIIKGYGIETYPMVSSYPYPPDFLDWMRDVFSNPQPFISTVLNECKKYGWTGINIDWEPTVDATAQDATDYVTFLNLLTDTLNAEGYLVTVDFANWNPIWDWNQLAQSKVNYAFMMTTYTGNFTLFQKYFTKALSLFSPEMLGVGLQTVNDDNDNKPYTEQEIAERFNLIYQNNVQQIDIWDMPIPANWWKYINKFVGQ